MQLLIAGLYLIMMLLYELYYLPRELINVQIRQQGRPLEKLQNPFKVNK